MNKWIVFQVGSREHYALPRMFFKDNSLKALITDYWFVPNKLSTKILKYLGFKVASRYNADLIGAKVIHWNYTFLLIDLIARIKFIKNFLNRDKIAQYIFSTYASKIKKNDDVIAFSYNYTAYRIFKKLQKKNINCILGQIDAGPLAGEINRKLYTELNNDTIKPNKDLYLTYRKYWDLECSMSKYIVVNSEWSKNLLCQSGIDETKIQIIEIAYVPPAESILFKRSFAQSFSQEAPLKVLYLGTLQLLKGIYPLIQAIKGLSNYPVQFYLVGTINIPLEFIQDLTNVNITGNVPKEKIFEYIKECDVLILPTFSDGFAMVQLEAQAWKMPIIVSERCGKVVSNGVNGWILKDINSNEIMNIIIEIINNPNILKEYSDRSINMERFNLENILMKYKALNT